MYQRYERSEARFTDREQTERILCNFVFESKNELTLDAYCVRAENVKTGKEEHSPMQDRSHDDGDQLR